MASIEKRSKNTWRLTVELGYNPDGTRVRKRKTISIEDEALLKTTKKLRDYLHEELTLFKREVESGEYIKPERMTLDAFITNEWEPKHAKKTLSPLNYITTMRHVKNHIVPSLGHKQLNEIKPLHIVTFLGDLELPNARKDGVKKGLSSHTRLFIYNALRNVFRQARAWELISKNPMDGVAKPILEKKKQSYYDADEAREVIRALYSEPVMWRMLCLTGLVGGLRRGEIIALKWDDFDFEQGTISITKSISVTKDSKPVVKGTKNEEERIVDMPEWYMSEMAVYQKKWKKDRLENRINWGDDYVFHAGTGKALYHTVPTQWWNRFIENNKLKKVRFHDLRHTSATLLIEAGASMKAIQERLGHKQQQTTADIYAHVTKKVSKEVAEKFNALNPLAR